MPLLLQASGYSDVGRLRARNEDAWWAGTLPSGAWLLVVCDGLGGYNAGEVASAAAVRALREALAEAAAPSASELQQAIFVADSAVKESALSEPGLRNMGTTLTAAWIGPETAVWGQVGDSRLFRLRGRQLDALTPQHSAVGRLRKAGALTEEEAQAHPRRSVIDQCLGYVSGRLLPEAEMFDLHCGDVLVLCSDGVTNGLKECGIAGLLSANPSAGAVELARALVDASVEISGSDNTTAIVAKRLAEDR